MPALLIGVRTWYELSLSPTQRGISRIIAKFSGNCRAQPKNRLFLTVQELFWEYLARLGPLRTRRSRR